jgi:hypothetical protein
MLAGFLFSGGIVMAAGFAMGAANNANRAKIVGTNACAECHKQEAEALKGTHHFKTFREMPRNTAASKIAQAMGVRRVKAESVCLNCHFTVQEKGGTPEPISGISCESCHGAGQDWIKVHSGYSGKTAATESKSEAAARWKLAEAKGMIRPGSLYALAKNCYSCHVVPHEELVNKGGHLPGSAFELVAWSQGEVRHNTWHSKGKDNIAASPDRRRMLYLVGLGVELETALRAIGTASARKIYAFDMAARADRARDQLAAAAKAVPGVPEIGKLVEYGHAGGLKLNNASVLTAAADGIAKVLQAISDKYDGSTMAGLDGFIPAPDTYKGRARAAAAVK